MRKSFQPGFKVEETKGKAAEGDDSLLQLNLAICEAKEAKDVFLPMWQLCLVCANQRKLIAKVRGDSNDFLNYATLGYVQRWQKQFGAYDGRRPVQMIQNWIPYILGTIRFALISFNKEVFDYDFLPLPTIIDDEDDNAEGDDKSLPDYTSDNPETTALMSSLLDRGVLHNLLLEMPKELRPYTVDILYYVREGVLLSRKNANFVKVGKNVLYRAIENYAMAE